MKELKDYLYYHEEGPPTIDIYLGDCLEVLSLLPQVDLIVTDPPYGIDFHSAWPSDDNKKDKIKNDGFDDYIKLIPLMLGKFRDVLKDGGICCCCGGGGGGTPSLAHLWIQAGNFFDVENVCIWDKGFVGLGWRYRFQWEAILIAIKGERKVWNGGTNASNIIKLQKVIPQNGEHPTLKPESLMTKLIMDNSNKGDTVLDPFAGSCTTLVSAKEAGRNAIGIELVEKYAKIGKDRVRNTVMSFI